MNSKQYKWSVVGAGPAGLAAVGLLLDAGVSGDDILFIDPHFEVGDFGRLWGEVNSNTSVKLFRDFLMGIHSFDYDQRTKPFVFDALDAREFTTLNAVAEALKFVTTQLQKKVITQKTEVTAMAVLNGSWQLHSKNGTFTAEKVILTTGADVKSMDYPSIEKITLSAALTPSILKTHCQPDDVVAVFGSSHSAMIAIRNLIEAGVKNIVNFYLSPLRYAVILDDWILYDDTGLKGETAAWVRENISKHCLPKIQRYLSTREHIDAELPRCNKAIYAVGFEQRHLPVTGVSLSHYDRSNGIIAPGLFGAGIGFPVTVIDPFGRHEANVGLWKFLKNMRRTLPLWQRYGL